MQASRSPRESTAISPSRRGASTVDWVLVLGIVLPLAAFVLPMSRRMMQLVYEMTVVLISWPFL